MITEAKFAIHQEVNGIKYGRFVIVGKRWSDVIGEWIYGAFQINEKSEPMRGEVNLVESMITAA